uniref:Uncharacterized protein n=1 Tax=Knipowitschia caucasica TaxID=637954 RepID=A0AAV2L2A7_KNICA
MRLLGSRVRPSDRGFLRDGLMPGCVHIPGNLFKVSYLLLYRVGVLGSSGVLGLWGGPAAPHWGAYVGGEDASEGSAFCAPGVVCAPTGREVMTRDNQWAMGTASGGGRGAA